VLNINPRSKEEEGTLVVHLPMANPLDPNQIFQVSTIAEVNPTMRVIAAGNVSTLKYNTGKLNSTNRRIVASGNFNPTVEPLLRYLDSNRVEAAEHAGYSYGADKAVTATAIANHAVSRLVTIEPVSLQERSLLGLAKAFGSTNAALKRYVEASKQPLFVDSRKDSVGADYALGLARLTNIAVARGLTHPEFLKRMEAAFNSQGELLQATIAWGGESELTPDNLIQNVISKLTTNFGNNRVRAMRMPNDKHALANNIYLHAAIVREGLS
jgi:hypothetical protein